MVSRAQQLDDVFRALANRTRRDVLERLVTSPATATELAEPFDMALPSFCQHLRLLEDCGLVRSKKLGRSRMYELAPTRFKTAETWLARQRAMWERRLDQLDAYLSKLKEQSL